MVSVVKKWTPRKGRKGKGKEKAKQNRGKGR
jgi:hypothetical protein